jgi:hypothetical protein
MNKPEVISIDGVNYVKEGTNKMEVNTDGMKYVIVRGDRSGVFAGYLKSRDGREITLLNCRRLWYWDGAASLSQLAVDGVSKPKSCKFPCEIAEIMILDTIEIIPATEKSKQSIAKVSSWEE